MGLMWAVLPAALAICQAGIWPTCKVIFQSHQAGNSKKSFTYCLWGIILQGGTALLSPFQVHGWLLVTEALPVLFCMPETTAGSHEGQKEALAGHQRAKGTVVCTPSQLTTPNKQELGNSVTGHPEALKRGVALMAWGVGRGAIYTDP